MDIWTQACLFAGEANRLLAAEALVERWKLENLMCVCEKLHRRVICEVKNKSLRVKYVSCFAKWGLVV